MNFKRSKEVSKKEKGGRESQSKLRIFLLVPSIGSRRKNQELKSGNRGDQRSHLRRQGSVYAASEKKKKKGKGKSLKIMGEGKKEHTRGPGVENLERLVLETVRNARLEMETSTKYRMPLTVIGMAVEKSSISRSAGAGQAAL